jgi:AbrB family looped-hinge helix DNA binding protein
MASASTLEPGVTSGPEQKLLAKSKISGKGQITLPVEVRKRLGVKEGESVKFVVAEDGRTIVLPVREEENPFEKWIGSAPLTGYKDTAAWISDVRDDEDRKADLEQWREIKKQAASEAP